MTVLDASVVVELLLDAAAAEEIRRRLSGGEGRLFAPHLLDLEVAQVLRRYASIGDIEPDRARGALEDLAALPLIRYPHQMFLGRIWELRQTLTAYDAAYVALAEALPAPLLTRDARLARSSGHEAVIELL